MLRPAEPRQTLLPYQPTATGLHEKKADDNFSTCKDDASLQKVARKFTLKTGLKFADAVSQDTPKITLWAEHSVKVSLFCMDLSSAEVFFTWTLG